MFLYDGVRVDVYVSFFLVVVGRYLKEGKFDLMTISRMNE